MGFQNPIVAGGGELQIPAIKSEDYVEGKDGWRIARDGNAEFGNVSTPGGVTGTVGAFKSLSVGGVDILKRIDALPKGIIAWGFKVDPARVYPNVESPLAMLSFYLEPNRLYRVRAIGIEAGANADGLTVQALLRFAYDDTVPDNNASILAGGIGLVSYTKPGWSGTPSIEGWGWNNTSNLRRKLNVRLSLAPGPNVTSQMVAYNAGIVFYAEDMGPFFDPQGAVFYTPAATPVTVPPAKVRYDETYVSQSVQTYEGNGNKRTDVPGVGYQGYYSSSRGNHASLWFFDWPVIRNRLAGSDIIQVSVYFDNIHMYSSAGGTAWVGHHSHTGVPNTYVGPLQERIWAPFVGKGGEVWFDAGVGLGIAMRDSGVNGLVLGRAPDNNLAHYGYFNQARIRVVYDK